MRITLDIDDDLHRELKQQSQRENISLTELVNRLIRQELAALRIVRSEGVFRQKTYSMGVPLVDLTKALALAGDLEDAETIRKMSRHQ